MKLMVTNGGPHPPDKWAEITSDEILGLVQIDEDSASSEAIAARLAKRDLARQLFSYFMMHHAGVQQSERAALAKSAKRVDAKLDPTVHLKAGAEALAPDLAAIFDLTPFADHFRKPDVITVVNTIIAQHSGDVMHLERRWHADRQATKE